LENKGYWILNLLTEFNFGRSGRYDQRGYYTYYFRDPQGNVLATYKKRYLDSLQIDPQDYNWLLDSLMTQITTAEFADFMEDHYTHNAVASEMYDYLDTNDDLYAVVDQGRSYYENVSGFKEDLTDNIDYADFLEYCFTYINSHMRSYYNLHNISLIEEAITDDCSGFFTDVFHDPQLGPTVIDQLWMAHVPPPPIGNPADKIGDLCTYPTANDLASSLSTNEPAVGNLIFGYSISKRVSLFQGAYSESLVRSHVKNNGTEFSNLYSDLQTNQSSALNSAYNDFTATELYNYLIGYDMGKFIHDGVEEDWESVTEGLIAHEPNVMEFFNKVYQEFGEGVYNYLDGFYERDEFYERLELAEHYMYGSSRLGLARKDTMLKGIRYRSTESGSADLDSLYRKDSAAVPNYVYTRTLGQKLFELTDHLSNVRAVVCDRKIAICDNDTVKAWVPSILSANDYYPFGSIMPGRSFNSGSYRYGAFGHELDNEVKGTGNHLSFGDYGYDTRLGRRWQIDPKTRKYPEISPYAAFANNPIYFTDPDGKEPVKKYVGSISDFTTVLNNSPSKVGQYTGDAAHNYMMNLGKTEFSWKQMRPLPKETGYFNKKKGRYIYTEKGGWVDMTHFLFYAGRAYKYKQEGEENPIGEAVQDGYMQERSDQVAADHSAFSYEDLPSDKYGADFAVNHFDPESDKTFSEQLETYMKDQLGATSPEEAPNYEDMPDDHTDDPPSRTNDSTDPVYSDDNP